MRRAISVFVVIVVVLTGFLSSYVSADACHGNCYTPCNGCYLETPEAKASTDNARVHSIAADAFPLLQGTPGPGATPVGGALCEIGPELYPEIQDMFPGTTVNLVGFAHRELEEDPHQNNVPDDPLCLIQVLLDSNINPDVFSNSLVDPGEVAVFHVHQGTVQFTNEDREEEENGYVRVRPNPGDTVDGLEFLNDGSQTYLAEEGQSFTVSAGASVYLDSQPEIVALEYRYVDGGIAEVLISSEPLLG